MIMKNQNINIMKNRIKQILRENDFGWVSSGTKGDEFRRWVNRQFDEYMVSDNTLDELERFIAELPMETHDEFISVIQKLAKESYENGRDDGYHEGHDDGYNEALRLD